MLSSFTSSSRTGRRSSRLSAFSMLELVMVMMIVGTFAAIALPRYANSLARYRLDCAAKRVVADLQYARMLAMTKSKPQSVTFSASAETYTLSGVEGFTSRAQTYVVSLNAEPYNTKIGWALFGFSQTVTFDIYGAPSAPGWIYLQCGNYSATITVDSSTGKASIS